MAENKSERQMLGSNTQQLDFRRQYSIKNLYHANQVIDTFSEVEYENINAFCKAMTFKFTLNRSRMVVINILQLSEWDILKEIIQKSQLTLLTTLIIKTTRTMLLDLIKLDFYKDLSGKRFNIAITDYDDLISIDDFNTPSCREWCQNNILWIEWTINYYNYHDVLRIIPYFYVKGGIRFVKLKFDYESFGEMKFDEISKLEYWIGHLMTWYSERRGESGFRMELYECPIDNRPIYVSDELKLYYNQRHFNKNKSDYLIDLIATKDLDGEAIGFKQLNNLRQYMDLTTDMIFFDFKMNSSIWSLIDYYQNKCIQGHVNEVPLITTIIMNFIGSVM